MMSGTLFVLQLLMKVGWKREKLGEETDQGETNENWNVRWGEGGRRNCILLGAETHVPIRVCLGGAIDFIILSFQRA